MKSRAMNKHHTDRVVKNRGKLWEFFARHTRGVEPHRFHKRKPFDCGKTDCQYCSKHNDRKYPTKYKEDYFEGW